MMVRGKSYAVLTTVVTEDEQGRAPRSRLCAHFSHGCLSRACRRALLLSMEREQLFCSPLLARRVCDGGIDASRCFASRAPHRWRLTEPFSWQVLTWTKLLNVLFTVRGCIQPQLAPSTRFQHVRTDTDAWLARCFTAVGDLVPSTAVTG